MITSADLKFIIIDKQEDLPTEEQLRDEFGVYQGILLMNGDVMMCNRACNDGVEEGVTLNTEATELYKNITGFDKKLYNSCHLIKKHIKYLHNKF